MTTFFLSIFTKIITILFLLSFALNETYAQEIKEIQFCESIGDDIDQRNPVNPRFSFILGEEIYCWVHATSQENIDTYITVEWYHEGTFEHSYNLDLLFKSKKTSRYRTWALTSLDYAGNWRAEIKSSKDSLLNSADFKVYEELQPFPGKQRLAPFSTSQN